MSCVNIKITDEVATDNWGIEGKSVTQRRKNDE